MILAKLYGLDKHSAMWIDFLKKKKKSVKTSCKYFLLHTHSHSCLLEKESQVDFMS